MNVTEINDGNIEETIKNNKKAIIDCYAPWCGPCKTFSPVFDELSSETNGVNFFKLNTDNNKETVKKYDIMSIPTVLIFDNGVLIQKAVGYKTKEQIKELM